MDTKPSQTDGKPEESIEKKETKDDHFYDRWKSPEKNKMGNDISGDMKIAESNGELEGGQDKRWHLEDDDQD